MKNEWPKGESNLDRSYNIIAEWVSAALSLSLAGLRVNQDEFAILQKLIYEALEACDGLARASAFTEARTVIDILRNRQSRYHEGSGAWDIAEDMIQAITAALASQAEEK